MVVKNWLRRQPSLLALRVHRQLHRASLCQFRIKHIAQHCGGPEYRRMPTSQQASFRPPWSRAANRRRPHPRPLLTSKLTMVACNLERALGR
jgi:hypothetical protein